MPNKMKSNNFSDSKFFFHNCPICQAMKKAEQEGRSLSMTELKRVFKKANKRVKVGNRN